MCLSVNLAGFLLIKLIRLVGLRDKLGHLRADDPVLARVKGLALLALRLLAHLLVLRQPAE